MRIVFEQLRQHGYVAEVVSSTDGEPDVIEIRGTDHERAHDIVETIKCGLKSDFPHLDHDTLVGIAYKAMHTAQAHDIVRVCSLGD